VSSRLDAALRKLVEAGVPLEDLNPEVLSRDFEDPRFSRRPMEPAPVLEEPFMGDWLPALADKIGSGIGGAARWVDENVPSMGGPVDAKLLASLIEPLRGSDLGATGTHAGDVYPGVPKAAGMVIGPAAAFAPKGYRAIKRLFGGADEAVDQLKLPGTARTETKKPEPEKPQEKTIDKLSRKARQEEALEKQGELPQSLDYELEVREISPEQYDDLLEEGWHYQEILDAHPRIPYSVRKEGREILGLESPVDSFLSRVSRTPKPARTDLTEEGFDNFHYNDYRNKFATGDLDNLGPMEKVVKDFSERDPELWRSFVRDVAEMDPDDPFVITDFVENYMNTVTSGTHGITGVSILPSHNFIDIYRRTAAELPELFRVDPETLHIIYSPDPNWVRSIDAGLPVQKGYFRPPTS